MHSQLSFIPSQQPSLCLWPHPIHCLNLALLVTSFSPFTHVFSILLFSICTFISPVLTNRNSHYLAPLSYYSVPSSCSSLFVHISQELSIFSTFSCSQLFTPRQLVLDLLLWNFSVLTLFTLLSFIQTHAVPWLADTVWFFLCPLTISPVSS